MASDKPYFNGKLLRWTLSSYAYGRSPQPCLVVGAGQAKAYARGSGEPLLLIHSLGSSGADWAFQIPSLAARFRVIAPDLPGCGSSPALPAALARGLGMRTMARLLAGRSFPETWQRPLRERAVAVMGSVPAAGYIPRNSLTRASDASGASSCGK